MSVKEILQSLVDDGLVDSERIGTSNYFWAFPSKAANIVCYRGNYYRIVGIFGGVFSLAVWWSRKKVPN